VEVIENSIITKLIEATKSNKTIQEMIKVDNDKITTDDNGLIYFHGLIYVPKTLREEIINGIMILHYMDIWGQKKQSNKSLEITTSPI